MKTTLDPNQAELALAAATEPQPFETYDLEYLIAIAKPEEEN